MRVTLDDAMAHSASSIRGNTAVVEPVRTLSHGIQLRTKGHVRAQVMLQRHCWRNFHVGQHGQMWRMNPVNVRT